MQGEYPIHRFSHVLRVSSLLTSSSVPTTLGKQNSLPGKGLSYFNSENRSVPELERSKIRIHFGSPGPAGHAGARADKTADPQVTVGNNSRYVVGYIFGLKGHGSIAQALAWVSLL